MKLPSLCICLALAAAGPLWAETADVTKLQQNFSDRMIQVRIGDVAEVQTISIAAYQVLLKQGVPTTLVNMPADEQDSLRAYMLQTAGWSVGVFR